jgi:DNA-binding beta-propeller fold protein YncE
VITTNWGEDTCSIVDFKQGAELSKIHVGMKPYDVKVDPRGRFAYVTCSGEDFLSTIDLQAMLEMQDKRVVVGASPRDVALNSDNTRAVVACAGTDSIAIVDIVKHKVLYTVNVGTIPYGVALSGDGTFAVITCWGENSVALVRLSEKSGEVLKRLQVGSLPYTAVLDGTGRLAIVSCFGSHKVDVIDLKSQELIGAGVKVGRSPWGVAVSETGNEAIVANFYSGDASLLKIDTAGTPPVTEEARIPLSLTDGGTRRGKNASFSYDPSVAILSDLAKNELLVLDLKKRIVEKTIPVGRAPYGIAWIPRHGAAAKKLTGIGPAASVVGVSAARD